MKVHYYIVFLGDKYILLFCLEEETESQQLIAISSMEVVEEV